MYTYIQERCGILEDELRRFEAQREEDSRRLQEMTTLREKDADQAHFLKEKVIKKNEFTVTHVTALTFESFWQLAALDLALAQVSMEDEGNLFFFLFFLLFFILSRVCMEDEGSLCMGACGGVGVCMGV